MRIAQEDGWQRTREGQQKKKKLSLGLQMEHSLITMHPLNYHPDNLSCTGQRERERRVSLELNSGPRGREGGETSARGTSGMGIEKCRCG